MNTYAAVLRGINVSGQRIMPMKELKALCESVGLNAVMTYIQSGNIVFKSDETNTEKLTSIITEAIEKQFNFSVPVLVMKKEAIESIITQNPFQEKDIAKLHVTLLNKMPAEEALKSTRDEKYQSDEFIIIDTTVYLYCPDGYGMTKFSTTFFEKKLGVQATTRNWKTINAILDLMNK